MTDEQFDRLMREAAHTYNRPPDVAPLDEMWTSIERAISSGASSMEVADAAVDIPVLRKRVPSWLAHPWLRAAAVLAVGVGLGRASVTLRAPSVGEPATAAAEAASSTNSDFLATQSWLTDQYFGQTVALLIALPSELSSARPDSAFARRVDDLLLQTRLLLDSPGASDPALHTLLEDLEVVLAQIVRLQADRDPMMIDLFNEALEQGELMPRLREAAIHHMSD